MRQSADGRTVAQDIQGGQAKRCVYVKITNRGKDAYPEGGNDIVRLRWNNAQTGLFNSTGRTQATMGTSACSPSSRKQRLRSSTDLKRPDLNQSNTHVVVKGADETTIRWGVYVSVMDTSA